MVLSISRSALLWPSDSRVSKTSLRSVSASSHRTLLRQGRCQTVLRCERTPTSSLEEFVGFGSITFSGTCPGPSGWPNVSVMLTSPSEIVQTPSNFSRPRSIMGNSAKDI